MYMSKKIKVKDESFNPSYRIRHNIYLLEPTDKAQGITYDCNNGQVVIADSEDEARKLCQVSDEGDIWIDPQLVTCIKIGETTKEIEKGTVLVSNLGG
jgi:hypothetical protein